MFFCFRHLFYQQILQDLQSGQLDIQGRERLIPKLVSLIAQVEYGDQTSNSYQLTVYETILHSLNQQANRIFLDAIWQVSCSGLDVNLLIRTRLSLMTNTLRLSYQIELIFTVIQQQLFCCCLQNGKMCLGIYILKHRKYIHSFK